LIDLIVVLAALSTRIHYSRGLAFARQSRSNTKARQPNRAGRRVHENVGRLDILVDKAPLMELAERTDKTYSRAEERR
jgi:hypothetical protein